VADPGQEMAAGDELRRPGEDKIVGRITSAVWSPLVGAPAGLAYVRGELEPGQEVSVGATATSAVVHQLPLKDGTA